MEQKTKTLVIHPNDPTTDVLSVIYENKDWTIVRTIPYHSILREMINEHDRIIMLGHGSPYGLMNSPGKGVFVIDPSFVDILKYKKQCVYVWCNADKFVERYDLKDCFYTGMIVSELREAEYMGISHYTLKDVDESNELFCGSIARSIDLPVDVLCENVKKEYITETNNIIHYNKHNIYYR